MRLNRANKRTSAVLFVLAGLLVIAGLGGLYWQKVYTNPSYVFDRMLENALHTTSITKQSVTSGPGQQIIQNTALYLSPEAKIHSVVDISQTGEQQSRVKRETITSKTENFVRLVSVETNQKRADGKPFDFSSVTGLWGGTPADSTNNSFSQLYGQNVAVPYANLPFDARQTLLKQIKNDEVYKVNYGAVKRVVRNGRPAYEYPVDVKPEGFIKMMKTLGSLLNIPSFEQVKSDEYKNIPSVKFTFTVDILSGDLSKVDFGGGQVENYSGIGLHNFPSNPDNAVSMSELQNRLQKLQQ